MTEPWQEELVAGLHPRVRLVAHGQWAGLPATHTYNPIYGQNVVWTKGRKGMDSHELSDLFTPEN